MKTKQLLRYIFIALLVTGITACSDSGPTDTDNGQPPAIPDLAADTQPDISFFENNNPQGKANTQISANEYANFSKASLIVTLGTFFASTGQLYFAFINPANNNEAEFNNGQWEWSYSYAAEGQSVSILLTAQEESASSNKWAMFISYDDGQGGGYENYKLIEGTISNDGAEGNWTFNVFATETNTETPAINTKWTILSDTEKTITSEIYDYDDGSTTSTINYEQDGVEFNMSFMDPETSEGQEIYWNTETKIGYVIDDGSKECWDSALENVPCTDVGL